MSLRTRYCQRCGRAVKDGGGGHLLGCPPRDGLFGALVSALRALSPPGAVAQLEIERLRSALAASEAVVAELVKALPKCRWANCEATATREMHFGSKFCDLHAVEDQEDEGPARDLPHAAVIRRLSADAKP